MKAVFKITKNCNKKIVEPLFLNEDTSYHSTSLERILNVMKSLLTEEQKEKIYFSTLYVCSSDFNDDKHSTISILVKMVDGVPYETLRVSENSYDLNDCKELLNQEVKDEHLHYEIFKFPGKLTSR